MARSKKDKKVVVNQAYFELIERKAELLDEMADGSEDTVAVHSGHLKTLSKISKDWDKVDASGLNGSAPHEGE